MIAGDEQILFSEKFLKKIGAPIITTGNELEGEEIAEFSKKLNVQELYLSYSQSTTSILYWAWVNGLFIDFGYIV